jgi:hypothetical protein
MHIDVTITEEDGYKWSLTRTKENGEPKTELREETWRLLRKLHHEHKLPWVCMGDLVRFRFRKWKW